MTNSHAFNIYNIPAGHSFTDVLAKGLIEKHKDNQSALSKTLILLPTRRASRSLQEAFLRQTNGQPILLPQMKSFGDIDAEELLISGNIINDFDLLPAMPPLKRQILLAKIIAKIPDFAKSHAQNMALAQALGQLMDQIYTENLSISDLPNIIDRDAFAAHWQITLDFLSILSEHWPKILETQGCIDAADRRNRLILMLNNHWQTSAPAFPVIAAGSTGSIPATAKLLKTISTLPQGEIILPGLDTHLSNEAWLDIEEGHPQATLKKLFTEIECERHDVKSWPFVKTITTDDIAREKLFSHVMTPASQTDQWTKVHVSNDQKNDLTQSLKGIELYECETPQEQAQIISLIMREALEKKEQTAALITPDRNLARRVSNTCKRWGIEVDDSGGKPLSETLIGLYLRLSAKALIEGIKPVSLLALLKHEYASGYKFENYRKTVRGLDKDLMRGIAPQNGFEGLKNRYQKYLEDDQIYTKPDPAILTLLEHIESIATDALSTFSQKSDFKKLLESHLNFIEKLSTSTEKDGRDLLWSGEDGESASKLLAEIYQYADHIGEITPTDYLLILEQFMAGIAVRPKYGTHPRLMILGQLEARLIQTDIVILSGLNEGTWPADAGNDPWMSRPMRENFGLPLPERSITLAAHDFVQGACSQQTYLTRSKRQDGTPTVPARWLQRLDTFLTAIDINPDIIKGRKFSQYANQLDEVGEVIPFTRPAPTPPVDVRPTELSVTHIETWLKDPYQIYASKILKLRQLDPIEKPFDAAERGNILHDIIEEFTNTFPKDIPSNATDEFIQISKNIINSGSYGETTWSFWKPRLTQLSKWIVNQETTWRQSARYRKSEIKGAMPFKTKNGNDFTLTARADRIDQMNAGGYAIIDYKSGGSYSIKKLETAELNQLPLEAAILEAGGFHDAGIPKDKVSSISYWKMTGGREAGKVFELKDETKLENSMMIAYEGLQHLIETYNNPNTPYMAIPRLDNAPRFNDYAHLERVKEWAALGDSDETGEAG